MDATAIVVTFNEVRYLERCLQSLRSCDEILVVDLGSTDGSREVALRAGATVLEHPWVPIVEEVRRWAVAKASHDWVLLVDPDEVLPQSLLAVLPVAMNWNGDVGIIRVPMKFYFCGEPLTTTAWGCQNYKSAVVHRQRVKLPTGVHQGPRPLSDCMTLRLQHHPSFAIDHYWVDSYKEYFAKHRRYLKQEGRARYQRGDRFSVRRMVRGVAGVTKANLVLKRGALGGWTGWFLTVCWTAYTAMAWLRLWSYQRLVQRKSDAAVGLGQAR